MSAQVAADLRAAAEVLRRDGWTQGTYHDVDDDRVCHCAVGAIEAGTGYWTLGGRTQLNPALRQRVDAAWSAVTPVIGTPDIFSWNDDEDRTADEVIAALEAAADAAEATS